MILLPAPNFADKFFWPTNYAEWRKIFWFTSTIFTHSKYLKVSVKLHNGIKTNLKLHFHLFLFYAIVKVYGTIIEFILKVLSNKSSFCLLMIFAQGTLVCGYQNPAGTIEDIALAQIPCCVNSSLYALLLNP